MSDKDSSIITKYVSVDGNKPLSKVVSMFKEKTREILVFEENDVFLGYLTKRYVTHQSKIQPDAKVSSLIKQVPTVQKDSAPDVIARAILSEKIFSVPVVENGKVIGVIRDIDLLRDSEDIFGSKKVKEAMTKQPIVVTSDTSVAKFIATCRTNNISRTPVVNESNELVGIMSPHDTTDLILSKSPKKLDMLSTAVKELMTQEVVTCTENDFLIETLVKLDSADHKALIVVDKENHPVGIITTTDLLETVSMPPETEGYYFRVLGDVDDSDMEPVIDMGVEVVKKYADIIGTSGQLFIHAKAIPKRKFRGEILYQVRVRISTNKGKTYVSRSDGYGVFGALAVALDRIEREIVSERELEIQRGQTGSERYILEEIEEL
ncbi:MAG: Inosine-5'-monophosphate dehydrogenase [Candidatus Heimdallarchaeota archaeon AB_125]|nr:MAG: Inosine-5'-monophosphate dehydrogenase [Candidatus Heimdallarchaeota archaeon AB_125]